MDDLRRILLEYWGYNNFRSSQEAVIKEVVKGKDVLALLPTGGGKSLCFQVPAMAKEGICIVVSPLIALMQDQVKNLEQRNIKAKAIFSGKTYHEIDLILDSCVYGEVKFLYISPERIDTEVFQERFKKMNVNLIAIDEAHCISQWGFDFRPSYLNISKLRVLRPEVPIIALTASATPRVREDILERLQLQETEIFVNSVVRKNIQFITRSVENKNAKLIEVIKKTPGSGIVYVRSRRKAKDLSIKLNQRGYNTSFYHAGVSAEERSRRQELWTNGVLPIIVCTNAFGMGIDKPDVRWVVHLDIPDSLEAYYQEAGRAGRDGKKSYAVLIYNKADISRLKKRVEQRYPDIKEIKRVYEAICNHLKIAISTGKMLTKAFDIASFSKLFNIDAVLLYNALKILNQAGYILPNEGVWLPSRLKFNIDKRDLYKFQVEHINYDQLIRLLLRSYGGVLHHYTMINENWIASRLKIGPKELAKQLKFLHKMEVVKYVPYTDFPTLTLLKDRVGKQSLLLDKEFINQRKKVSLQQCDAMIHYILDESECKQKIIGKYFGLEEENCGVCATCLSNKNKLDDATFEQEKKAILEQLKLEGKAVAIEALQGAGYFKGQNVLKVIRFLLDEGVIELNNEGKTIELAK